MECFVNFFDEVGSTNSLLKELAKKGAPIGTVIAAKRQTDGRGRLDRRFESPEGGLYMSLLLPMNSPSDAGLLTTHAAVATARAIKSLSGIDVGIKWVNDLYYGNKKLCGILAEAVCLGAGTPAVLGIGVNLYGKLPQGITDMATTIEDVCGKRIAPKELLDEIIRNITPEDYAATMDEYIEKSIVIGKKVTVRPHEGKEYEATAVGIDRDGSLLVKKGEKTERLFFGEVSLKL